MGTLTAYGDSITAGYGITNPSDWYVNLIGASTGLTVTNNAVAGMKIGDPAVIDAIYAETVDTTKNYLMMIGTNNGRINGADPYYLDTFRGALAAAWMWLAIPDSNKVKASNCTRTGTWVVNTGIYGSMDYRSTTIGSTIGTTVTGTSVYVGHIKSAGSGGTFSVSIDGTNYGTFTTDGSCNVRYSDTAAYQAYGLRFSGLSHGAHTVLITVTSATGGGNAVYIDWIAGNGFDKGEGYLYVSNLPRATNAYYTGNAPYTDAVVSLYNAAIEEVYNGLKNDGLNIILTDTVYTIDRTTDMQADGLHPDEAGNVKMADAFLKQISEKSRDKKNTPWFAFQLPPGWINFDTGGTGKWGGVRYMKDENGFVHLRGLVKNNSGSTNSNTVNRGICQLPIGFRPMENIRLTSAVKDAFFEFDVQADGWIVLTGVSVPNTYWVSLSSAAFYADQ